jgi:hypothetical protein
MNPKRKQIVQEAMLQMRATREALGPDLMTRLQLLLKDFDPGVLAQMAIRQDNDQQPQGYDADVPPKPGMERVDHRKNLMVVMKFLQLKQGHKNVQEQVRMMLAEHKTLQ